MVTHSTAADRSVFDAIADPTRRSILDRLSAGRRSAGEIAADYRVSRPAISKHLRVLEQAGLVRIIRHGRHRLYELDAAPLAEVDRWIGRYRLFWSARLLAIKDIAEQLAAMPTTDSTSPGAQGGSPGTPKES